jgi:pimeloyl-ACP methyl ester carboxylesterase
MRKRDLALVIAGAAGAAVAVKFLTRAGTVSWDDCRSLVPHSDRSRFVNVDGARVHYQEFGDRTSPPIVLIHGYTASVYVWHAAAPLLAEAGFRVIAPDLVGFGYSEKPRWFEYSIASQARMISRLMDTLGIGRAHIVGSSYGGAVAMTLALDMPERVDKLVLSDTVCNDEPKNHPVLRLAAFPIIGELITPFVSDSKAFLRKRMHNTLAPANHHLIDTDRVDSIRRPLLAADAHHSLLATSRNWQAARIERDAHLIEPETLIIWGANDRVIPIAAGRKLHKKIPGARMTVIRNCGHVPQEEKSEIFTGLVTEFCQPNL